MIIECYFISKLLSALRGRRGSLAETSRRRPSSQTCLAAGAKSFDLLLSRRSRLRLWFRHLHTANAETWDLGALFVET